MVDVIQKLKYLSIGRESGEVPEVLMGDPQFMDGFNGQSENKKWGDLGGPP